MASADRRETFDIEHTLLSEAYRFSFIQAVRLLRLASHSEEPFKPIRVRPDLSWSTPSQEIISVEKIPSEQPLFKITVTFLELYGAGSPLPMFYTQDLFREQIDACSVNREFLDVFNGIIYEIYFKIWQKYDLLFRMHESPDSAFWEQLFCIAGIGNEAVRGRLSSPEAQVFFSGFLSRPVRTAEGLRAILSELLGDIPVSIEQCVTRTAPIPELQQAHIGQRAATLGSDIYIGKWIKDRMGLFRVTIGPVSAEVLDRFLPGTEGMSLLDEQIRLYVDQPLQWEIEVKCRTEGMSTVCLGGSRKGLLGWNSWVFSGELEEKHVVSQFETSGSVIP